ncbi:MAG: hypothetical protein AAFR81_12875 [Chloroflexota bacterium]
MKTLSGTVYCAPSGYWYCRDTTIADVLAFEREELSNEDQLPDVPETVCAV